MSGGKAHVDGVQPRMSSGKARVDGVQPRTSGGKAHVEGVQPPMSGGQARVDGGNAEGHPGRAARGARISSQDLETAPSASRYLSSPSAFIASRTAGRPPTRS